NLNKEIRFDSKKVSILEIVREALTCEKECLEEKDIHVDLDGSNEMHLTVEGDRKALVQVVSSLLKTSINMSPEGGAIVISFTDVGRMAQVSISDTGGGMARDEVDQLFDRFGQKHSVATISEALGLYMARRMVERHRGTIWCESFIGIGSTFIFRIPKGTRGG
ncbi:MAG: HAMP domain-containing sensor histidine kinase, partial [Candidatus Thermoplasmatota archaeon]|nr:HAMP domain-containing sensor histidine kinase [Candidatus Thermoplasmatota archaeon]